MANCTHIFGFVFPVFFLLLLDHLGQPLPSGLEEVGDAVGVDDATGHNVAKIFVGVFALIKQGIGKGQIEDFGEHVHSMDAVHVFLVFAGTLQLVANGNLELDLVPIFENEAGPARDAHEVVLFLALQLPPGHLTEGFLQNLRCLFFLFGFHLHIFIELGSRNL